MEFIEVDKSICVEEWSMHELHSHAHYEIYYLSEGSRTFFLTNALYNIQSPCIVVIPPHVMHKTEGGPFERHNVNVVPTYLDPFQKETLDAKALHIIKLNEEQKREFLRLIEEAECIDAKQKHGEYVLKALFSYLVWLIGKTGNDSLRSSVSFETPMPPLVLKVINHLNAHYGQPHTLESIAEHFFVSKAALIYNFKKYTNSSPIDFLLNVRLTKAKELLVGTHKSVNQISEECGFSSPNYFGLIFKQKEHLSPMHYRKYETSKIR